MTPRCYERMLDFEKHGPMGPLSGGILGDLPEAMYVGGEVDWNLTAALEKLDPRLRIVYDRFTAPNQMSPAHHVIQITQPGGTDFDSEFRLIFSCQFDVDQEWPHGEPRIPGQWVMDELRSRDKASRQGSEERIDAEIFHEAVAESRERKEEGKKADVEFNKQIEEEIVTPYLKKKRKPPKAKKTKFHKKASYSGQKVAR